MSQKQIDPVAKEFARRLRETFGETISEIVLFGSRAKGEPHGDSDYDFLVVVKAERFPRKERLQIFNQAIKIMMQLCDVDTDVLVMTEREKAEQVDKPYTVVYQAFQEGAHL